MANEKLVTLGNLSRFKSNLDESYDKELNINSKNALRNEKITSFFEKTNILPRPIKMLQGKEIFQGNIVDSGSRSISEYMFMVEPNTQYVLTSLNNISGSGNSVIVYYDSNKQYISASSTLSSGNINTITTPNNCYFIRYQVQTLTTSYEVLLCKKDGFNYYFYDYCNSNYLKKENIENWNKIKNIDENNPLYYGAKEIIPTHMLWGQLTSMTTAANVDKSLSTIPLLLDDDYRISYNFDFVDAETYQVTILGFNSSGTSIGSAVDFNIGTKRHNIGIFKGQKISSNDIAYFSVCVRRIGTATMLEAEKANIEKCIKILKGRSLKYSECPTAYERTARFLHHNGVSTSNYPQYTMSGIVESMYKGYTMIELDCSMSSDGVIFLLHNGQDLSLETNGSGNSLEKTWSEIEQLYIPKGTTTGVPIASDGVYNGDTLLGYKLVKLEDALRFARKNKIMCQIDLKNEQFSLNTSTNNIYNSQVVQYCKNIRDIIYECGMENQVLINGHASGMYLPEIFRCFDEKLYVSAYTTNTNNFDNQVFYTKQNSIGLGRSTMDLWLSSSLTYNLDNFVNVSLWARERGMPLKSNGNTESQITILSAIGADVIQVDYAQNMPAAIYNDFPIAPSSQGTYTLKITVDANGVPSKSWVSD